MAEAHASQAGNGRLRRLHPALGLEVVGVDASRPLAPEDRDLVLDALFTSGVAILRDQAMTEDGLGRFAAELGPVYGVGERYSGGKSRLTRPDGVFAVSNLDAEGRVMASDERLMQLARANELWHTDSTFVKPRAMVTMLHARSIPSEGGDTEFCDTRLAFESLAAAKQTRLRTLTTRHSFQHSRSLSGVDASTGMEAVFSNTIARPLVHRHAPTGREALCLASHICSVDGLSPDDGADLVAELTAHATQRDVVYAHRWRVGDLVLWDDRCTMHRARPYDYAQPRDMRSARLDDLDDV